MLVLIRLQTFLRYTIGFDSRTRDDDDNKHNIPNNILIIFLIDVW